MAPGSGNGHAPGKPGRTALEKTCPGRVAAGEGSRALKRPGPALAPGYSRAERRRRGPGFRPRLGAQGGEGRGDTRAFKRPATLTRSLRDPNTGRRTEAFCKAWTIP